MVLIIFSILTYPSQCESWHLLCIFGETFQLWGQLEMDLLALSSVSALLHLGHSDVLCVSSSSCIGSPSSVQVSSRTFHRWVHTYTSGILFYGGYLASYSFQNVGTHCSLLSHSTKCCHGHFSWLGAQGCAITTFYRGCSEMCVVQTRVLFFSLSGSGRGKLSMYAKSCQ